MRNGDVNLNSRNWFSLWLNILGEQNNSLVRRSKVHEAIALHLLLAFLEWIVESANIGRSFGSS